MKIAFDHAKNSRNIAERGLSFERAQEFDFDHAVIKQDLRKEYPEARYVATGFFDKRMHILCFAPIKDGIRVISFRKANQREIVEYERTFTSD